ncbi:MAG: hypothetical protein ACLVA2_06995 [Clostridia bacterium]
MGVFIKKEEKKKNTENNTENEKNILEDLTIEELLIKLREEKNWTYIHLMQELNKLGKVVKEKDLKKWELGLEYPNTETIYKLAQIYVIPSEIFINAKNNSFKKGNNLINLRLIKWICYFTGISLKIGYWVFMITLGLLLILSLWFFVDTAGEVKNPFR